MADLSIGRGCLKVVIIRHSKVDFVWSKRCTSKEFDSECDVYDSSPIKETVNIQLLSGYKRIYISELSRSRETAERLYPNGEYTKSGFINEVPLRSSFDTKICVPLWLWNISGRLQWFINSKRQPEGRKQTIERARRSVEMICRNNEDCAVITHGFFMHILIKEMRKAGFRTNNQSVKYKNGDCVIAEKEGCCG
jgi:broad specificity phosphatase PhoE